MGISLVIPPLCVCACARDWRSVGQKAVLGLKLQQAIAKKYRCHWLQNHNLTCLNEKYLYDLALLGFNFKLTNYNPT